MPRRLPDPDPDRELDLLCLSIVGSSTSSISSIARRFRLPEPELDPEYEPDRAREPDHVLAFPFLFGDFGVFDFPDFPDLPLPDFHLPDFHLPDFDLPFLDLLFLDLPLPVLDFGLLDFLLDFFLVLPVFGVRGDGVSGQISGSVQSETH